MLAIQIYKVLPLSEKMKVLYILKEKNHMLRLLRSRNNKCSLYEIVKKEKRNLC